VLLTSAAANAIKKGFICAFSNSANETNLSQVLFQQPKGVRRKPDLKVRGRPADV
jgi:hypothetical protein